LTATLTNTDASFVWDAGVPDTFAPNRPYTATITLLANPGYNFTSNTGWSLSTGIATATIAATNGVSFSTNGKTLTVRVEFPTTAKAVVDALTISGLTAPVIGAAPATLSVTNPSTAQYSSVVAAWEGTVTTIDADAEYQATITLTPTADYNFGSLGTGAFTVSGDSVKSATFVNATGVITVTFLKIVESEIALTNVPTAGDELDDLTLTVSGTGFGGTVAWSSTDDEDFSDDDTFKAGKTYIATITLTATSGNYTLIGVPANYFTLADDGTITTPNTANNGVIIATFTLDD
jgi:hypothetical protein